MKVKLCNRTASPRICGPGWSLDLCPVFEGTGAMPGAPQGGGWPTAPREQQAQGSTCPLASGDIASSPAACADSVHTVGTLSSRVCLERNCKI